jgi:DNA-binding NtrC family response regulator
MPAKTVKLLLVEDEDDFRDACGKWMRQRGFDVEEAGCGADAISKLEQMRFDVAVLDINMPGMSGLELLQRIRDENFDVEVLVLTGENNVASAVAAMKLGACDFISKPCSLSELEHHIGLANDRGRLRRENLQLKAVISRSQRKPDLIGKSVAIKDTLRMIEKVAPTDSPVLIQGESGTGKEVVARMIQRSSQLCGKSFVTINCAALPEQLVESELFGHQKGAFTGATAEKAGLFEIADGGTLFIDEIGELPLALQPKLLRVLEDGSMRRVGSHQERRVEVRLIAATNRDLSREVAAGNFREDLYYRINVLSIDLPPLRDRQGDVDCLIDHFLPSPWTIDSSAREAMNRYAWPGNVRQLMNVLRRATVLAEHDEITLDDLPRELDYHEPMTRFDSTSDLLDRSAVGSSKVRLDELTRVHVLEVLANEGGNKAAAARRLGIHRRKLYRMLERFGTNPQDLGVHSQDQPEVCTSETLPVA